MHWGGGTPTHLRAAQLERLHRADRARTSSFSPGAEQLDRGAPARHDASSRSTRSSQLGFTRVSMGVQDLDPHVQEVIHRDQTTRRPSALVARCRERGFDGRQPRPDVRPARADRGDLRDDARRRSRACGPTGSRSTATRTCRGCKRHQRALERTRCPVAVERARLFALALERLGATGYEVIGLDHFALPDRRAASAASSAGTLASQLHGLHDARGAGPGRASA